MAQFAEQDWKNVVNHLTDVLGDAGKAYQDKQVAKLVAAIPYLAGADDPDRQAVSNLLILHAATKARKLFDHRESDNADLQRRIAAFEFGPKADPKVVQYGKNLLTLIMLSDHEKDLEADKKAGKYNPLAAGVWNASAQKKQVEAALASDTKSAALYASYMTPEKAVQSWWQG